jgi:SOS-response transcriptional repressor LexA
MTRKLDKDAADVVAGNLRALLQRVGKTDKEFVTALGSTDAYQILEAHRNIGPNTRKKIVRVFHDWGQKWVTEDEIVIRDPMALRITERMVPVFDAMAGQPYDFDDKGYPVGESDKFELANTRDPNAFWVKVHGDSMVDAGILPGSRVLIEPNLPVENGNIVFVRRKGEVTIKKLIKKDSRIILQPMNSRSSYEPIIIDDPEELKTIRIYRATQFTRNI